MRSWAIRGLILATLGLGSCASLEDRCLAKTNRMDIDPELRREYFRQCVNVKRGRGALTNALID